MHLAKQIFGLLLGLAVAVGLGGGALYAAYTWGIPLYWSLLTGGLGYGIDLVFDAWRTASILAALGTTAGVGVAFLVGVLAWFALPFYLLQWGGWGCLLGGLLAYGLATEPPSKASHEPAETVVPPDFSAPPWTPDIPENVGEALEVLGIPAGKKLTKNVIWTSYKTCTGAAWGQDWAPYKRARDILLEELYKQAAREARERAEAAGEGHQKTGDAPPPEADDTTARVKRAAAVFNVDALTATPAQVQALWRKLAKQWHPDKYPEGAERDRATAKMAEINAARDLLSWYMAL